MLVTGLLNELLLLVVIGEIEQVNIDGFREQDAKILALDPSDFTGNPAITLFDDCDQFKRLEKALRTATHSLLGQIGYNS